MRKRLSDLRYLMQLVEKMVEEQGKWIANPSIEQANEMFEVGKDVLDISDFSEKGRKRRGLQMKWTSMVTQAETLTGGEAVTTTSLWGSHIWGGRLHHVPQDFAFPNSCSQIAWQYWMCGDRQKRYPPLRNLSRDDMPSTNMRKRLSDLRYLMQLVEKMVEEQGKWIANPSIEQANEMFEVGKDVLDISDFSEKGRKRRGLQMKWTSMVTQAETLTGGEAVTTTSLWGSHIWGGRLHHVPQDFAFPNSCSQIAWQYWMCGDRQKRYPPLRNLSRDDMPSTNMRKRLSDLRYLMQLVEKMVEEQGKWIANPSIEQANEMFEVGKDVLDISDFSEKGRKRRGLQMKWTSMVTQVRNKRKSHRTS
ncbi:D-tyrosyl-tRNAtyr deacylase [Nitzschia inconspicua]|uniref:D-tyrosyl-tRNAtyr deacylase n=1 Tax=Nitzschia inconspicua TaxID=303405 RepID=A0A9K3L421_9STRA|nr:D-tyrosyl-tRNAtyr deacylase [Nitzschia inconspicua]